MKTRTLNFILTIVFIVLGGFATYVCWKLNSSIAVEGLERLSLIITFPICLIFYLLLFSSNFSALINSIKAISSSVKAIKIISIILLILSLVMIGLTAYLVSNLIKII